ncbi:hypothetical protein V2J09_017222 [Rumex salicifolius]
MTPETSLGHGGGTNSNISHEDEYTKYNIFGNLPKVHSSDSSHRLRRLWNRLLCSQFRDRRTIRH